MSSHAEEKDKRTVRDESMRVAKLENQIVRLESENRRLREERDELIAAQAELEQEIENKIGHIEQLLPVEREYEAIKKSISFRIMRGCCKTIDSILFVPKFILRGIYTCWKIASRVNIPKLKIAWGYCMEEGLKGACQHLARDYHQGELKKIQVTVKEEVYTPIETLEGLEKLRLPKCENPFVSIIIPAYNQFTYTYYCLESIIKNSGDIPFEVILADDCSNDLTVEIEQVVENLIVARTPENLLFLRNCNHAAQFAKGKYLLLLNNDTQVQENWLKPLVDLCEADENIGLVGSKLVYSDGTLQEAGGIIWSNGAGWNYGRNDDAMKPEYNYVRDVDYISGASIMIRKVLWDQIGGFDDYFAPAYCEDSDLAFQVRKQGYRVVYQPASVVVHYEGKSNGVDVKTGIKKYQIENGIKLREKWKAELREQYSLGQNVFKARERGKRKKTILIIDHYVPQFDKDAGSKTTFQYIKMFINNGYSVKFLGDNFFQHEPYTSILQQMGVEVLYGPWYAQHWKEWILENKNNIDFVYLNRPHITIKYIDFLKGKTKIKCIYYGHDLHFMRLKREYELTGNEEKLRESEDWKKKELYIMQMADMSYYPSCVEEQEIHRINPAVPVKAITAYVYEKFRENLPDDFSEREGIVFVGGFVHPPNEDAVRWFAKEVYPLICKKKKIPFYIVGSYPTDEVKKLAGNGIIVKGFVSEEELRSLYDSCRMVVVPLRYGAGVKGKVVEALYYGTPMVTTTVGAEGIEGIEKVLRIADSEQDFASAVLGLYTDIEALKDTQKRYQKFVREYFSEEAVWNIVQEDFV